MMAILQIGWKLNFHFIVKVGASTNQWFLYNVVSDVKNKQGMLLVMVGDGREVVGRELGAR